MLKAQHQSLEEELRKAQTGREYTFTTFSDVPRISAHGVSILSFAIDFAVVSMAGIVPIAFLEGDPDTLSRHVVAVAVGLLIFLVCSKAVQAYETASVFVWRKAIARFVAAIVLTFVALMLAAVATRTTIYYSHHWLISWASGSIIVAIALRLILLAVVEARFSNGACSETALIVSLGRSPVSSHKLAVLTRNRIRAIGHVQAANLDDLPDIKPFITSLCPGVVLLDVHWNEIEGLMNRLTSLPSHALDVLVLPHGNEFSRKIIGAQKVASQVFLQVSQPPISGWNRAYKRIEDVVVASLALLLVAPLMMVVSIAIRIESKGPILFKQRRVGFNGRLIEVWKFRSMYAETTDPDASRQTSRDDPRVTRVGRFIRRTSLDELPQFFNVLRGDMSVVGPRPHALSTSAEGRTVDTILGHYASRHRVKPGITGWAQVNGARGELTSLKQVEVRTSHDLHYIEHWSLWFDLKIILMTMTKVFGDDKAY